MSMIATAVKHLFELGASQERILSVIAEMEADLTTDKQAARRREKDRERKKNDRALRKSADKPTLRPQMSAESADIADIAAETIPSRSRVKEILPTYLPEEIETKEKVPLRGGTQKKGNGASRLLSPSSEDIDFSVFWEAYPHKVEKMAARKAFAKVRREIEGLSIGDMIAGVQRYVEAKSPDCPYCNPATWLNAGRWMDEPAPPPEPRRSSSSSSQSSWSKALMELDEIDERNRYHSANGTDPDFSRPRSQVVDLFKRA